MRSCVAHPKNMVPGMFEVRLAWRREVIHRSFAPVGIADRWVAATEENQQELQDVLLHALRCYGAGTHWIEHRERPANA